MIDSLVAAFRGATEMFFVLRGRSVAAVGVIAGFVIFTLIASVLIEIGEPAGVVIGVCLLVLLMTTVFASRKSASNRIVRNMAERDSLDRKL